MDRGYEGPLPFFLSGETSEDLIVQGQGVSARILSGAIRESDRTAAFIVSGRSCPLAKTQSAWSVREWQERLSWRRQDFLGSHSLRSSLGFVEEE